MRRSSQIAASVALGAGQPRSPSPLMRLACADPLRRVTGSRGSSQRRQTRSYSVVLQHSLSVNWLCDRGKRGGWVAAVGCASGRPKTLACEVTLLFSPRHSAHERGCVRRRDPCLRRERLVRVGGSRWGTAPPRDVQQRHLHPTPPFATFLTARLVRGSGQSWGDRAAPGRSPTPPAPNILFHLAGTGGGDG